ncbi:MAG: hypothetical protein LC793_21190 [Thermomicrobia bacterium]|nr:hypothetical protein [Thermomicrobia bacterium]
MTVGQARNAHRLELVANLKEALTLLEDEAVLDKPEQLDAVSATLYFSQPIADHLAQRPLAVPRPISVTWKSHPTLTDVPLEAYAD